MLKDLEGYKYKYKYTTYHNSFNSAPGNKIWLYQYVNSSSQIHTLLSVMGHSTVCIACMYIEIWDTLVQSDVTEGTNYSF